MNEHFPPVLTAQGEEPISGSLNPEIEYSSSAEGGGPTPVVLERYQPSLSTFRNRYDKWKQSYKPSVPSYRDATTLAPEPLQPLTGGIEEQLPSFVFGSSDSKPMSPPETPHEQAEFSSSNEEDDLALDLSLIPAPPRAPISAWSKPLLARPITQTIHQPISRPYILPSTKPLKPTTSQPANATLPNTVYPDLSFIARGPKDRKEKIRDHGVDKGKLTKKSSVVKLPNPALQPIFDEWIIAQPVIAPSKGKGGKVDIEEWGMEAARTAKQEEERRKVLIASGYQDPCGGW